jgi:hypothetical protein
MDEDELYCDHWEKRGIKVVSESEFEALHNHGRIVCEDYEGVQPPTYTLEQLRCTTCDAKLIRVRTRQSE